MNAFRIFTIGGLMSYRALFNWQRPSYYIPTMLAHPVFQILFFSYLGRFSHVRSDAYFVVGNSVQVCAMSAVYGVALTVGGERWTQTLGPLLATPANRLALFLGRALPHIVGGFVVSAFGFVMGRLLLHFDPPLSSLPVLALVVLVSTASCTGFGLVVGGLGLRLRDPFLVSNPAYFLMLLFCGVNVPLAALPGWMSTVGHGLPLTHGIEAARKVAAGASFGSVDSLLATELLIGACYFAAAYVLMRVLETEARRRASFDLV